MKSLSNRYLATLLLSMTAKAAFADRLVDPTQPAHARPATNGEVITPVRVEAIMQSGGARLAIVNGKVVRAGDHVGDARIDEVLNDGVRFTRDGHSQVARLDSHLIQVRQPVAPAKDES